jgi:hypothetical protein
MAQYKNALQYTQERLLQLLQQEACSSQCCQSLAD